MPTAERLRELLDYDTDTGHFTWKVRRSARANVGDRAGCRDANDYVVITIDGVRHYAHRLAFLYVESFIPPLIDHIDGKPSNNHWSNLRAATYALNAKNKRAHARRNCKLKGVYAAGNRFKASVSCDKTAYYLGTFDTEEQAHAAYCIKAKELFGEFFNPG